MKEQEKQLTPELDTTETVSQTPEQEETYLEMSPIRLVMRRFFRSKLSIVGILMIVFLFLFSFLGPVVYQRWGEETVDRTEVSSFIYQTYHYTDANGNEIEVVEQLEHISGINNYASPDSVHILGTDDKGMDVFVRLMYGGRISLTIGFIVVILETLIGVLAYSAGLIPKNEPISARELATVFDWSKLQKDAIYLDGAQLLNP